ASSGHRLARLPPTGPIRAPVAWGDGPPAGVPPPDAGASGRRLPHRLHGAAVPASTTTAPVPPAPASPLPAGAAQPFFDTVHPMSGFVAFGDFGGGPAQGAVAASMLQWARDGHRVDALVTTGDNVYDFGEPQLFEAQLRAPYTALQAGGRPLWATLGNHDE